eukprot:gene29773-39492_t
MGAWREGCRIGAGGAIRRTTDDQGGDRHRERQWRAGVSHAGVKVGAFPAGDEGDDEIVARQQRHGDNGNDVQRDKGEQRIGQRLMQPLASVAANRCAGIDDGGDHAEQRHDRHAAERVVTDRSLGAAREQAGEMVSDAVGLEKVGEAGMLAPDQAPYHAKDDQQCRDPTGSPMPWRERTFFLGGQESDQDGGRQQPVGTPSFPTAETFREMMPAADQWPVSDSWAYHDWHQAQAGDVKGFMAEIANRFVAPADLADFEKRAQLLNYESHRAIFEGMNDGLFVRNSGRLLWMTQPAWPSTLWQIYSHNYDTQAYYFGFKKGTEPVHVQLNLPGMDVAVVNSLANPLHRASVRARNYSLAGALLSERTVRVDATAFATTTPGIAINAALFDRSPIVLTKLELFDARGALLSDNFYWLGHDSSAYAAMARMIPADITVQAQRTASMPETEIKATMRNEGSVPALMIRLSAVDSSGTRILPAYWSDNYV